MPDLSNHPILSMIDAATGGAGEGQPALSPVQVESYLDNLASSITIQVQNEAELPADAHSRQNGEFSNVRDMTEYLIRGGLIIWDEENEEYQPIGWVYFRKITDGLNQPKYRVYIRDRSD